MIVFKNPEDQKDFRDLDYRLMAIVGYAERLAWALEMEPLTITSIRRDDGTTHSCPPPYRFIDWGLFRRIDNEWFRALINKKFPYGLKQNGDPGETIVPLRHGTAPHFHAQVSPK